jgi:hypothetical protein
VNPPRARWPLRVGGALVGIACRAEVPSDRPEPPDGRAVVAALRAPFDGVFALDNVYDHAPGPRPPGLGPALDTLGRVVLGTAGHRGYDWALPVGTPLRAPADGVVVEAGVRAPFYCAALGRVVEDQLVVVVRHTAPDGRIYETGLHHLSEVLVRPSMAVAAGAEIGRSGSSGCSVGPHLHFEVAEVDAAGRRPVDPYGWSGSPAEPASAWLWAPGLAAPWIREHRVAPDPSPGAGAVVESIRYDAWRGSSPKMGDEVVLRALAPSDGAAGALVGMAVQVDGEVRWRLPPGATPAPGERITVAQPVAAGADAPVELLPAGGGVVELIGPDGAVWQRSAWALGAGRQWALDESAGRPACVAAGSACVAVPLPGPVSSPRFSPDGHRVAVQVGDPGARRVAVVDTDAGGAFVEVELGDGGWTEPANLAWLDDDLLVFDAVDRSGVRDLVYVVPGLRPARMFPADARGGHRELRDARGGEVLFWQQDGPAGDLRRWRKGDGEPRPFQPDPRVERGGSIGPDGGVSWILADEVLHLAPGAASPTRLGAAFEADVAPTAVVGGATWARAGRLFFAVGNPDGAGLADIGRAGRVVWLPALGAAATPGTDGRIQLLRPPATFEDSGTEQAGVVDFDAWSDGVRARFAWIIPVGQAHSGALRLADVRAN